MRVQVLACGLVAAAVLMAASLTGCATQEAGGGTRSAKQGPTPEEALAIATDAYVYGYPLVTMEITRRVMTNVPAPEGKLAPMGQFAKLRSYPTPADKEVTAPNADTLYTLAWVDVAREPWVVTLPDAHDRYYLMPMLDGWTDVFQVPGKRTTGTKPQQYAITGPGWRGTLPHGVTQYKSPTAMVWLLGRIYCDGTSQDLAAVHTMQDEIRLFPLSAYGKAYTPPAGTVDPTVDMKSPVREQVNRMDAATYFGLLASLLRDNPPAAGDAGIVAKMALIGVAPGRPVDTTLLTPEAAAAMQGAPRAAQQRIMGHEMQAGKEINGWTFSTNTGTYGSDYLQRAFITAVGLGANRPQDAIYPMGKVDSDGKPLDGANRYVIHFDKGQTPPVKGFWSLTMYDSEFFFVPNALERYTLSSRFNFSKNADGSIDLYVQNSSPGKDKEANWLPAPTGPFVLMFRYYWPEAAIVDQNWKTPHIRRVN